MAAPIPPPGLDVLFHDNHLLVVHKPAGLLTQPAAAGDDSLLDRGRTWVREQTGKTGNIFMGLVHRLDRNVSGVVVLARTSKAASRLSDAFAKRNVDKRYLAVVVGDWPGYRRLDHRLAPQPTGRGVQVVGPQVAGKDAAMDVWPVAEGRGKTLVCVRLLTGRKHQIRAQLAAADRALWGDPLYGRTDSLVGRPSLHAAHLRLMHPVRKIVMEWRAPLPEALALAWRRAGLPPNDPAFTDLAPPLSL